MRGAMSSRAWAFLCIGLALPLAAPRLAHAQEASGDSVAAARAHFLKGKELYQAGSYREAIVELDAARALDPKAKDLVFNLAIVHEKLAEVDEALRYARIYVQMDLEPAERARAETYIKRLEGAKNEVAKRPPPTEETHERVRGRLDAATITVGVVAIGALGAGVVIGIKALSDKPTGFVTGANGNTVSDLQNKVNSAHTEAIVADVCFIGAGVAAAGAAVLYFARYRDDAPTGSNSTRLSVTPLVGGSSGGLLLSGRF